MDPIWVGQFAVTAFFAIALLQSGLDKFIDSAGNLSWLTGHFANSPLKNIVPAMFWTIAVLETLAGILSTIGAIILLFGGGGGLALWGLILSIISLLCLFFGQRLAKDYGGAVVIASYFAVALVGLLLFK